MPRRRALPLIMASLLAATLTTAPPPPSGESGDVTPVHDPSGIVLEGGAAYVFSTSYGPEGGVEVRRTTSVSDLEHAVWEPHTTVRPLTAPARPAPAPAPAPATPVPAPAPAPPGSPLLQHVGLPPLPPRFSASTARRRGSIGASPRPPTSGPPTSPSTATSGACISPPVPLGARCPASGLPPLRTCTAGPTAARPSARRTCAQPRRTPTPATRSTRTPLSVAGGAGWSSAASGRGSSSWS